MGKVTKVLLGLAVGVILLATSAVVVSAANPTPTPIPFATPDPNATASPSGNPVPRPTFGPAPSAMQQCNPQGQATQGGVGIQGLITLPCIRGSNDPTLYEKYPASAYSLHIGTNAAADIFNGGFTFAAAFLFGWITTVGSFCAGLLEWTYSLQLTNGVGTSLNATGALDSVISGLHSAVYDKFLPLALAVAAIYVVWFGVLRRRMTVAVESFGWVLMASAVAALFFAAPSFVIGSLDSISLQISKAIMGTVASVDPTTNANPSVYTKDRNGYEGVRAAVNRYWEIYIYQPWEVAEFGSVQAAQTKAPNGMTYAEWDLQANASGDRQQKDAFSNAVHTNLDQATIDWYDGGLGLQRMTLSIVALITVTIASVLLIMIAGAVLIAQLGMVLMTMVAPFFFLIGIHPSTGRRIFMRWGELLLGFVFRRILYSAFLSIILVVGGLIIGGVAQQSWFLASVLQIALVIAAFFYRKPVAAMFSQVGAGKLDAHLAPHRERAGKYAWVGAGVVLDKLDQWGVTRWKRDTPEDMPFNEEYARRLVNSKKGGPPAGGGAAGDGDGGGEGGSRPPGDGLKEAAGSVAAGAAAGGAAGAAAAATAQTGGKFKSAARKFIGLPSRVAAGSVETATNRSSPPPPGDDDIQQRAANRKNLGVGGSGDDVIDHQPPVVKIGPNPGQLALPPTPKPPRGDE